MNLETFIHNNQISYYDRKYEKETFISNPKSYILSTLEYGDKRLDCLDPDNDRYFHTASIYILGLMLYKKINNLNYAINKFLDSNNENEFLYSWFMTSFIHDLGYSVVRSQNNNVPLIWRTRNKKDITLKTYNIINNNLSHTCTNVVPAALQKNIDNYKLFRKWLNEQKNYGYEFIDHGHFSGAYFIEDRKTKFKSKLRNNELTRMSDGVYIDNSTDLLWSKNILNSTQKKVCNVIVAHNMFFQKPNSKYASKYEEYSMNDMLIDKPLFSFNDYPFYFLLQLVDTIDCFKSYKKFYNSTQDEYLDVYDKILTNIKYEFYEDGFSMFFSNFEEKFIREYWKNIRRQKYWLPIDIKKAKNILKITFQ